MRLIRNIKKTPANEASMKMAHFSNIGVTEVFLEATPTMMITTVLFFLAIGSKEEGGLFTLLLGRSSWSVTLFTLGYEASILSSTFGVSRYTIFFNTLFLTSCKIENSFVITFLGFFFMG